MVITIKNIETKNIFRLEEKEATRVLTSNREKFVIVNEEQPVIKKEKGENTYNFSKMTLTELRDYCNDNNLKFNKKATKKELIALIEGNK